MQLGNVLHILLGASLVSIGFFLAALADRVKTGKANHAMRTEQSRAPHTQPPVSTRAPVAIPVVDLADRLQSRAATPAVKPVRAVRAEPKTVESKGNTEGGEDVIAALVAAGYKKPIATEATWACTAAERATIEGWTASALRRCARGGLS